jgi:hypothetical protein
MYQCDVGWQQTKKGRDGEQELLRKRDEGDVHAALPHTCSAAAVQLRRLVQSVPTWRNATHIATRGSVVDAADATALSHCCQAVAPKGAAPLLTAATQPRAAGPHSMHAVPPNTCVLQRPRWISVAHQPLVLPQRGSFPQSSFARRCNCSTGWLRSHVLGVRALATIRCTKTPASPTYPAATLPGSAHNLGTRMP